MQFQRLRRMRRTKALRSLVRETTLNIQNLVYPLFVTHETGEKREIESMPGCFHYGVDRLEEIGQEISQSGIPAVLLFGIPESKDETGSSAFDEQGVVQRAVRALKSAFPDLAVITDVCLCGYTSDGHCGHLEEGEVANDKTLKTLARIAVSHAQAGADLVAPSDMMDGRVGAIRQALDENNRTQVGILSYAAKYASAFYGPFRDAADSAPVQGDRRGYQMDPANIREAMRELEADLQQGADILMVKPGLAYLDVIREARHRFDIPLAAYNVSGEYAMVKAAVAQGWLQEEPLVLEILTAFRRAGADFIISYHALQAAKWLSKRD